MHHKAEPTYLGTSMLLRALMLGISGTIAATETDGADYPIAVPFNLKLTKMKVTLLTEPAGAMVVQLRKAAGPVTTVPTYSDVTGFAVTFVASRVYAEVDPTDVDVSEGDFLNISASTGSGTNMLVELIGKLR
jgi:hypothetical protein